MSNFKTKNNLDVLIPPPKKKTPKTKTTKENKPQQIVQLTSSRN